MAQPHPGTMHPESAAKQALRSYRCGGGGGVDTPALSRALRKLQDALESEAALSCTGDGDTSSSGAGGELSSSR